MKIIHSHMYDLRIKWRWPFDDSSYEEISKIQIIPREKDMTKPFMKLNMYPHYV